MFPLKLSLDELNTAADQRPHRPHRRICVQATLRAAPEAVPAPDVWQHRAPPRLRLRRRCVR